MEKDAQELQSTLAVIQQKVTYLSDDFGDFKVELKRLIDCMNSTSKDLVEIRSKIQVTDERVASLTSTVGEHFKEHKEQQKTAAARNWQLWVVVISVVIGIFVAVLKGVAW